MANMMADMRLIVTGAGGRMGRTLVRAIDDMPGVTLASAVEAPQSPWLGQDSGVLAGLGENGIQITNNLAAAARDADGIVDFTVPAATLSAARIAGERGLVHIVGTTGFTAGDDAEIKAAAQRCAIVKSGNMSLGVNMLAALVRHVAATLGEDFDIEIVEMHHNRKVDAPSGTALMLGQAAAEGRGIALGDRAVRTRDGHTGPRRAGDIGFATLRGGTVVGDHNVIFAGPHERIELAHRAEDRMIFARGALKAALWARGKKAGIYSMADVLGLSAAGSA